MTLFLLTFFLLYGGLHYYLFLKAHAALPFEGMGLALLVLFLLLMVVSPLLVRGLEKYGFHASAQAAALTGYSWMGFAFLCFCCFIALDLYRLVILVGGQIFHHPGSLLLPSPKYSFYIAVLLAFSSAVYGSFEARQIRTERIFLKSPKIPREVGKLKIAQISDVHLGIIVREGHLKRILNVVEKEAPDLLVSTGDLVDGQINDLAELIEPLRALNPPHGKFAITGNHEFYAGLAQALDFTQKAGFSMLRGQGLTVAGALNIAGVDDPAGMGFGLHQGTPEQDLLSQLPRGKFTLLLKHRPEVDERALGLFDLQISGHTHQGQIFPFRLLTRLFFSYTGGSFRLAEHSYLHVSRGSGTWGPPIRLLTPPEVTVYELVHEDSP
jgi:uncharacterized protein